MRKEEDPDSIAAKRIMVNCVDQEIVFKVEEDKSSKKTVYDRKSLKYSMLVFFSNVL